MSVIVTGRQSRAFGLAHHDLVGRPAGVAVDLREQAFVALLRHVHEVRRLVAFAVGERVGVAALQQVDVTGGGPAEGRRGRVVLLHEVPRIPLGIGVGRRHEERTKERSLGDDGGGAVGLVPQFEDVDVVIVEAAHAHGQARHERVADQEARGRHLLFGLLRDG